MQQQTEKPVAYMPFAHVSEYDTLVALEHHTGRSIQAVKDSILAKARQEGFKGTADERLAELGWWIEPVYRRATDERVEKLVEAAKQLVLHIEERDTKLSTYYKTQNLRTALAAIKETK